MVESAKLVWLEQKYEVSDGEKVYFVTYSSSSPNHEVILVEEKYGKKLVGADAARIIQIAKACC